jgi:hypothetical protein
MIVGKNLTSDTWKNSSWGKRLGQKRKTLFVDCIYSQHQLYNRQNPRYSTLNTQHYLFTIGE